MAAAPSLTPEALPAVTVPFGRTIGRSFASPSSVVSARGCSSVETVVTAPFAPGTVTGTMLSASRPFAKAAAARCCERSAKASWSARANLEFFRDVLAGFRHGIDAVLLLHQRVDEAPADGRVVDLGGARKGFAGLSHDEGRARHRFHAAGDGQVDVAGADGARRGADGVQPGGAEAVQRHAGDGLRQPGKEQRHPRDVAVVLARLVGAAQVDLMDHAF